MVGCLLSAWLLAAAPPRHSANSLQPPPRALWLTTADEASAFPAVAAASGRAPGLAPVAAAKAPAASSRISARGVSGADELFAFYHEANSPLKKFLHIIEGAPRYPVVVDADDRVLESALSI